MEKINVLIINGNCVRRNSSANLCHLSYIRGLVEAGCEVDLLSAEESVYEIDERMALPSAVMNYKYNGLSFYEKFSLKKSAGNSAVSRYDVHTERDKNSRSIKSVVISGIKKVVLGLYGVHGIYITFVKNASAFRSDKHYDYVISLSTPVTSHLLAHKLIRSGRVKCNHYLQIWEDPWYSDVYGFNGKKKVFKEERKLLSFAENVCYVSPLTLESQKRLFPEYADKMFWQPLPYYYKNDSECRDVQSKKLSLGYFGDYYPTARNIMPFYEAALLSNTETNICGNPVGLIKSEGKISVFPRISLDKLKPIEDRTDVLVFICNRQGGQIPGKVYQYAASKKTVLFILDGSDEEKEVIYNYFLPFNRFVFCDNNKESVLDAIEKIKCGDFGSAVNEPIDYFSPKKTVGRILNFKNEDIRKGDTI